jgi:molybdopterin/thiamine biosynthesis adenylyltransferase
MKKAGHFKAQPPGRTRRDAARARRVDRPDRLERLERFPRLFGLKQDAGQRLDQLTALLVGVGSIGATVALSLARLQIGRLLLVDWGRFKPASVLTQPVGPESLGEAKASFIAQRCRTISPQTRVEAWDDSLQTLPLSKMTGADVVVLAGDNLTVAREAGQRCMNLGLPLLHAAVHGETLTAQCRFFGNLEPTGPCPVCLFGPEEFRMLEDEVVWSCEGHQGFQHSTPGRSLSPTRSLRSLCALSGELATLNLVRWALELGEPVTNSMTEVCAYTWRTFVSPLHRNPSCPAHHERWSVRPTPRRLGDMSAAELLQAAGASDGPGTLALQNHRWVERGLCACTEPQPVNRFVRDGQPARARCRSCRCPIFPQPFFSHEQAPSTLLGPFLRQPLARLGVGRSLDILVNRHVLFVQPAAVRKPKSTRKPPRKRPCL